MLEVRGLSVTYGNVRAVDRLDLQVNEGEVAALVGPNGAGKTSTMMAISGIVQPAAGEITFEGTRIDLLPSHDIYKRGIVQVPEGRLILAEMTVRENLLLGADAARTNGGRRGELDRVAELFPVIEERMHYRADTLSGGQLQMLAIARGLMGRPRLFMLDEPSLGLAPKVVEEIFQMIVTLNGTGMTILLVEQNLQKALEIADRAYLLEAGRLIDSGPARELMKSDYVMQSYLGVGRREGDERPAAHKPVDPSEPQKTESGP